MIEGSPPSRNCDGGSSENVVMDIDGAGVPHLASFLDLCTFRNVEYPLCSKYNMPIFALKLRYSIYTIFVLSAVQANMYPGGFHRISCLEKKFIDTFLPLKDITSENEKLCLLYFNIHFY